MKMDTAQNLSKTSLKQKIPAYEPRKKFEFCLENKKVFYETESVVFWSAKRDTSKAATGGVL